MNKVRQAIMPAIRKNRLALKNNSYYTEMLTESLANLSEVASTKKQVDHMQNIIDIRLNNKYFIKAIKLLIYFYF